MNARRVFLSALFQAAATGGHPYCIQRNYQDLYQCAESDVDLLIEPGDLGQFRACLERAAEASRFERVLETCYVNHSFVYWHPEGGFLRVDLDTGLRWRLFPVLDAASVLARRRPYEDFYVPHPLDEAIILLTAALWRGDLSLRYRSRLHSLLQGVEPGEFEAFCRACFGKAGPALAAAPCQSKAPDPAFWRRARRCVAGFAITSPGRYGALLNAVVFDGRRLFRRLFAPPGISFIHASQTLASSPDEVVNSLAQRLAFVFPAQKFRVETAPGHTSFRHFTRRAVTLFKGGLYCLTAGAGCERAANQAVLKHGRGLYADRSFFLLGTGSRSSWLGHSRSGFLTEVPLPHQTAEAASRFIPRVLARQSAPAAGRIPGLFVVLIGLDGSGKTTLARHLCGLGLEQSRFAAIRYFHWIPKLFNPLSLPLPDSALTPRKPGFGPSPLRTATSTLRLLKTLVTAHLGFWIRVRSWIRQGDLVLADRYYYNYFLDPDSVRCCAPPVLLRLFQRWMPQPDLIVTLSAAPEILLARKLELSRDQIERQNTLLESMDYRCPRKIQLDARKPADQLARELLSQLVGLTRTRP